MRRRPKAITWRGGYKHQLVSLFAIDIFFKIAIIKLHWNQLVWLDNVLGNWLYNFYKSLALLNLVIVLKLV